MKPKATEVVHAVGGRTYRRRLEYGLVTTQEAASVLGVTTRTIHNLVAKGKLCPRRRGGRLFFAMSNVRAQRFYERRGFRFLERRRFGQDECFVYRLDRADYLRSAA